MVFYNIVISRIRCRALLKTQPVSVDSLRLLIIWKTKIIKLDLVCGEETNSDEPKLLFRNA